MEYQPEGQFTDGATQTVICRDFPVPSFRIAEGEERLEIITEDLHLFYNKKSASGQQAALQHRFPVHTVQGPRRTLQILYSTSISPDGTVDMKALFQPHRESFGGKALFIVEQMEVLCNDLQPLLPMI